MRVKGIFGIVLPLLVLAALTASGVGAQGGTWVSGVSILNPNPTAAQVTLDFYSADTAGAVYSFSDTIPANSQKTWYIPSLTGVPDGFLGSVVVSSDQLVQAIVNTQVPTTGTGTTSNPNRVGTSSAVNTPAPQMYAPQVMREYYGWNSYLAVQNAGSSSAPVTVEIYDSTGALVDTEVVTIPAGSMHLFRQADNTALGSSFVGSAKITSAENIAVVCNFYNASTDYTTAQFHSYNGFPGGATTLYVPRLVKDYYNYQSGLKVQNVGSANTTVTVTYYFGGATYTQTSPTIGPNQAWGPYLGAESQLPGTMAGLSGSGSAIITSSGGVPIVAIINEDNRVDPAGRGITYNAFLSGEETNTAVFPQVTSKYYGYSSGLQIQNVGTTGTATLSVTYSMSGRSDVTLTGISVAEGASWSMFTPSVDDINAAFNDTDFNGSAVVTANKPIVGIANLSFRADVDPRYGVNYGDSFTTYNGFNQ